MEQFRLLTSSAAFGALQYGQSAVFNGRVWLIGGLASAGVGAAVNTAWATQDGVAWDLQTRSAPWSARAYFGATVWNARLWISAGAAPALPLTNEKRDVWWSPDGVNWTCATLAAEFGYRWQHQMAAFDERLFVLGGTNSLGVHLADSWHSRDGTKWEQISVPAASHFTARRGHGAIVHQGRLYVISGWNGTTYLKDVWCTQNGYKWDLVTSNAAFPGRSRFCLWEQNGRLYISNGYNGANVRDIWSSMDGGANWVQGQIPEFGATQGARMEVGFANRPWGFGGGAAQVWEGVNLR